MSETANVIFWELDQIQKELRRLDARLTALRSRLAALGIVDAPESQRPRTGYRMVRGTHGVSYVADVNGVDPLPLGWEAPH